MFEQTFVQTQAATRRPWTVAMSLSLQFVVVGVILLIPLLHPAMMRIPPVPQARSISTWANLAPKPVPITTSAPVPTPSAIRAPRMYSPVFHSATPIAPQIGVPVAETSAIWQDAPAFAPAALLATTSLPMPAPVKPPAAPVRPAGPVRIGGDVESAKLIYAPHPTYPQIAIS
ncbi:MAG TPA: hypothetical protein VGM43_26160, partial [Bryobacteraceae bacterium]